ncbi:uncharacterized protein LAESUDRAFT_759121 [Laetiporus sulphureus 93-53]|uniref:Uncharacterized protein n=1 Tax=Laetiporus sulphureus 93-53 TaxID=1314785 RepID=A0A165EAN7_9APHY|nr:uncharacterized protein LAESUDRAFT_759121 [Laetiporus sulphureus 93-53]KZT06605.1 hypothetical protein LAESUDRAFT_759121 [Laetiporus sulphureus 93-53]
MDNNNSLKQIAQVGSRACGDMHNFKASNYFLLRDFVDCYANEVKSRPRSKKVDACSGQPVQDDDEAESDGDGDVPSMKTSMMVEGDLTDSDDGNVTTAPCVTNWKAAASEDHKRMWAIFDEAGIFVAACRHGLVLWVADMVQSGELTKYPLAILAKALEVFGIRLIVPYDIGLAAKQRSMQNHPNVIKGMGLEDGETLEHLFSASNSLASVIRYMSPYRRHVLIDLFFQQWNNEKYSNLSLMLYNNCIQALKIINEDLVTLANTMQTLGVSHDDLIKWSLKHFETLGQKPPWDVHTIAYVEKLQEWCAVHVQVETAHAQFVSSIPSDYTFVLPSAGTVDYYTEASHTQKLETKWHYSEERERMLLHEVATMEVKMGIMRR